MKSFRETWMALTVLVIGHASFVDAAEPGAKSGLWQITIVDFADRTHVTKECVRGAGWEWWVVFAGKTAGDESCKAPIATVENDKVRITQACESTSAEMEISGAGTDRMAGRFTNFSETPYGQAIPFHSKIEAQWLSAECR